MTNLDRLVKERKSSLAYRDRVSLYGRQMAHEGQYGGSPNSKSGALTTKNATTVTFLSPRPLTFPWS